MRGETVPLKRVWMHVFLNSRSLGGLLTRMPNRFCIDRLIPTVPGSVRGIFCTQQQPLYEVSHLVRSHSREANAHSRYQAPAGERVLESTDSFFILPETKLLGINQVLQCEVYLCKFGSQHERPRNRFDGGTELSEFTVSPPKTVVPCRLIWFEPYAFLKLFNRFLEPRVRTSSIIARFSSF